MFFRGSVFFLWVLKQNLTKSRNIEPRIFMYLQRACILVTNCNLCVSHLYSSAEKIYFKVDIN